MNSKADPYLFLLFESIKRKLRVKLGFNKKARLDIIVEKPF